jgi:hypothetical protein
MWHSLVDREPDGAQSPSFIPPPLPAHCLLWSCCLASATGILAPQETLPWIRQPQGTSVLTFLPSLLSRIESIPWASQALRRD